MRNQIVGTAVAAVFATAMVGAQAAGQGQQDQQGQRYGVGQQAMTLEGCLHKEHGSQARMDDARADARATGQARTDASAAGGDARGDAHFVLRNAEVRGDGATAGARGDAGIGTQAGQTAQAGQAGQTGAQSETAVGTSGMAAGAARNSYKVSGLEDDKLAEHAGQRVRIQGYIQQRGETGAYGAEAGRTDAGRTDADRTHAGHTGADRTDADRARTGEAATQPAGTTGTGVAGHGTSGTTAPGAYGATSHDHSRMAAGMDDMKEFRATSIERISGDCPPAAR